MAKAAGKKGSKKAAAKKPARKAPAKKAATKKTATKNAATKTAARKSSTARKSTARKGATKKAAPKKAAAKKTARKTATSRTATKKSAAKKSVAKKSAAKKAPARKAAAKKAPARKTAPKTSAARKPPAKSAVASRAARKPPAPSRARVLSRDGTPVARKVTIRTAVSRPTSPRKKREEKPEAITEEAADNTVETPVDAADEMQDQAEVDASGEELEIEVDQSQEPAFFLSLLAAIGAFEAFLDEETEETRAEAARRADDLIKAFQEPATLDDGKTLDEDIFARLVEEAGASERMAQWLGGLPKAKSAESFLDDRP